MKDTSQTNDEDTKKRANTHTQLYIYIYIYIYIYKYFPKTHQLHKLFNRSNVELSSTSLHNFKCVTNRQNKNILSEQETPSPCNCRDKTSYPLNES